MAFDGDRDFIGFSFGKWHSLLNNIYRTSEGSRYNRNLAPTFNDKTTDIPGGEGQYYFGTFHKNRTFTVNFAFDEMTESGFNSLFSVFNGKEIKELIFDEQPYKAYDAKVTGTPTLKYLCFEDASKNRIYKGEGSVQFTCYNPYAHTPNWLWTAGGGFVEADGRLLSNYINSGAYPNWKQWQPGSGITNLVSSNAGTAPAFFKVANASGDLTVGNCSINIDGTGLWDSRMGVVIGGNGTVPYTGKAWGFIPPGSTIGINTNGLDFEYCYY